MKYLGSKARIFKDILPIMLSDMQPDQCFVDAFCGSCSVIGAVPDMYSRIANDNNRYLVAMLKDLTASQTAIAYPCVITREFYGQVRASYYAQDGRYPDSLIGWVGFMASYGGRFFDGGYSGHNVGGRDYIRESIKNLMAQLPSLQGITWYTGDYQGIPIPEQSLIYCDPPYRGTRATLRESSIISGSMIGLGRWQIRGIRFTCRSIRCLLTLCASGKNDSQQPSTSRGQRKSCGRCEKESYAPVYGSYFLQFCPFFPISYNMLLLYIHIFRIISNIIIPSIILLFPYI